MKNNFCSNCGTKLKAGVKFCPECGTKIGGTKSSKKTESKEEKKEATSSNKTVIGIIIAVAAAVVLIISIITGIAIHNHNKQKEFKEDVTSLKSDIFKSFQDAELVGNQLSINLYVYTATSTNKYARYKTVDDAISSAMTTKTSEVAKVNSEKPGLEKRYKELMDSDVKENEKIKDIKDDLKDVYNAYQDVYKAAIKPAGTPTSMMQDYKEARANFTIKYSALNQLLKE
ncbi:MAG: zinc ribbon domain-containing protein [Bacilli bacterium]|nr:zinc ribbon domain-containing protein [Bacilli bacterium]